MKQTILLKPEQCSECDEIINEGEYAWVDSFEEEILCNACKENKEEYFGEGYTAKMD